MLVYQRVSPMTLERWTTWAISCWLSSCCRCSVEVPEVAWCIWPRARTVRRRWRECRWPWKVGAGGDGGDGGDGCDQILETSWKLLGRVGQCFVDFLIFWNRFLGADGVDGCWPRFHHCNGQDSRSSNFFGGISPSSAQGSIIFPANRKTFHLWWIFPTHFFFPLHPSQSSRCLPTCQASTTRTWDPTWLCSGDWAMEEVPGDGGQFSLWAYGGMVTP